MTNLSTKELNYLKDFLSWELLMAKKCNQYGYQEMIPEFQQAFHDAGKMHQQNYLKLVNYLQQVTDSQGGMKQ